MKKIKAYILLIWFILSIPIGILISLPLAIICITTYKYFKDDINDKIEDIKVERKNN